MKNPKLIIYYSIIFGVVLAKMLFTVYQESLLVIHSNQQAELLQTRKDLEFQQLQLTARLSQTNSYLSLNESGALGDFVAISQPLRVTTSARVAASQL